MWGLNFVGQEFLGAQISLGPNFLGTKKSGAQMRSGDYFSYSLQNKIQSLRFPYNNSQNIERAHEKIRQILAGYFIECKQTVNFRRFWIAREKFQ